MVSICVDPPRVEHRVTQVPDDLELLHLMMQDYSDCDPVFQWTNYWSKKCEMLLDFLKTTGLKDFRRNKAPKGTPGSVLNSFSAIDILPPSFQPEEMYNRAGRLGRQSGAIPLAHLSVSEAGNPESFRIGSGVYTCHWVNFYARYAYVKQFFDFGECTIVEIGSGSGKQAEMLKKAYPKATILLFDIPPQLYVANQYLKTVFPDGVVDYSRTRSFTSASEIEPGKIHLFPNWKIDIASQIDIDLLWNAASFQEMEPEIVKNYLGYVAPRSKHIYLMQVMYGQRQAFEAGQPGVLSKTMLPHYFEFLPDHEIINLTRAALATPIKAHLWRYSDTFWNRL